MLSAKKYLTTLFFALLILSLVGCSSKVDSSGEAATSVTVSEDVQELDKDYDDSDARQALLSTYPVPETIQFNENGELVVQHQYGETVVPKDAERIVCIKLEDLMLALGADMVAVRNFEGFYLEDELNALGIGTITVDEEADTVNLEEVLSYSPDLIIIRDAFDQTVYEALSQIAPTIAFDLKDSVNSLLGLGIVLDMADEAEARVQQFEDFILEARERLDAVVGDETVAMVRILKKEIRLYPYSESDMSAFLFDGYAGATLDVANMGIGLNPDPMVVEYDEQDSYAISMEMLPDLQADHIILVAGYGSNTPESVAEAQERYAEIKSDLLWQTVPAVKNDNIYEVDSRIWLTHGVLCTEMKIQEVLNIFLGD